MPMATSMAMQTVRNSMLIDTGNYLEGDGTCFYASSFDDWRLNQLVLEKSTYGTQKLDILIIRRKQ